MSRTDKPTTTQNHERAANRGGGESERDVSMQKGGEVGVDASARRSKADRAVSPKKAAETRKPISERTSR